MTHLPTPDEGTVRSDQEERVRPAAAERLRILTITTSYPNPREPGHSLFVRARLQHMAEHADLKVVAPVPVLDYSNPRRRLFDSFKVDARRWDEGIEVFHPRWLFPPLGTPWNIPCYLLGVAGPVRRLRRTYRFHVIDSHFGYPDGVAAVLLARRIGCPSVVTFRGNEMIHARRRARLACMRRVLRLADRVICVSEELRRFALALGVQPQRTRTIPNGVDAEVFRPRDRAAARAGWNVAPGEKVVLSAGSLSPGKGHHLVVQALHALGESGRRALFLLAGAETRDGRYEREIRASVSELGMEGRVRFLGFLPPLELSQAMSGADVFCLASNAEGWPNVVHEALACGTPVVATGVGGVPDMIPSSRFGILVPPGDQAALERALGQALDCTWDREAISRWGCSRTWNIVAREVIELMGEMLNERRPEATLAPEDPA